MAGRAIVVGAGVIGLAVARTLARRGYDVAIVEAEPTFGTQQSSRNSEVIHAGIYYPPGSLKARLCLEGKQRLYAWCRQRGVGHRRIGKLIVAVTDAEVQVLQRLHANALASGLTEVELVDATRCRALEPAIQAAAGLWSPTTGIIDSHGFMASVLADAEDAGAMVAWRTPFESATDVEVRAGGSTVPYDVLVNAAGAGAQAVAQRMGYEPPPLHLVKGSYFRLARRCPFRHLVYPVPASASLGVHLTLDLAGVARFGPDQRWVDRVEYDVDVDAAPAFYASIRRYWPDLPDGALEPDYAGVRAKVQGPGEPMRDWEIHGPKTHGRPGVVHLFGIESPGLTASLAIADHVAELL